MKVTDKFTIVVEAKDRGEVVQLSSSTTVIISIQDGNNNLPVIGRQLVGVVSVRPVGLTFMFSRERVKGPKLD